MKRLLFALLFWPALALAAGQTSVTTPSGSTHGSLVSGDLPKATGANTVTDSGLPSSPQGNGAKVQLSTGSTTTNDCVKYDANGNTVDAGAACGGSTSFANPTATCGTSAVNGSATTAMRSDAAPACPAATNSTKGLMEGDGSTIICAAGVCSATGFAPIASPFHPGYVSGRWYYPPFVNESNAGSVSPAINTIWAIPFYVAETSTFKTIGIVTTISVSGKFAELGIYANSNGAPGALVLDAGEVSTTTLGALSITISQSLTAGWYWLAVATNSSSAIGISAAGTTAISPYFFGNSSLAAGPVNMVPSVSWSFSTGNLPNPFGTPTYVNNSTAPIIMLQAN